MLCNTNFSLISTDTPPATPPIQQDDLNLLLQEGLQAPKGQVDPSWFPNAYGSTANTQMFYNQQGNLSTINMSATNLSTATHIPQVDGSEDSYDEPPVLCVRPPNLSSASLSTISSWKAQAWAATPCTSALVSLRWLVRTP